MPGQVWATNTLGGFTAAPYLTARLRERAQPLFRIRGFLEPREEIGKKRGESWLFDKVGNVATQGGTLVETNTIPETQFTIGQGTGVVTEYANSVPFTGKLDSLGQFEIDSVTEQRLRDDMVKVLESAAGAEAVKTDYVAVCVSTASVAITTNGTATSTATANLTAANVRTIVNFAKKNLIPRYDGQNYVMICSVEAHSGMHADVGTGGWQDVSKYTAEYAASIFSGEVGKFYGARFVEETGYLSNSIGSGSDKGQALLLGADSVYEAVVEPEHIRVKTPQDYGRDLGLAWYALLGFKIVWNRANDGEQHLVFVTSA